MRLEEEGEEESLQLNVDLGMSDSVASHLACPLCSVKPEKMQLSFIWCSYQKYEEHAIHHNVSFTVVSYQIGSVPPE